VRSAATGEVWDPAESEPWEALVPSHLRALNDLLDSLWDRSEFHRRKLAGAGLTRAFRVERWDDVGRLPFTTKDDLRRSLREAPPLGLHLCAEHTDLVQVQATSGTTGSPSYFGLTAADRDVWSELGARCLTAGGFRPGMTVLHSWSMSRGFSGGLPVAQMLQYLGTTVLPIGAEAGAQRLLTVLAEQRADAACGTPNFFQYLGDQAPAVLGRPLAELPVRHVVVGGEPGGGIPPIRAAIERSWGATCTEVLGNSDIAPLVWGECLDRSGMHFCGHGLVLAELVDPVTDAPVELAEGAEGELIYTSLVRQASPVLRFRSGDRVRVLGAECGCGRTSPKIRCVGRTDDMLIVRGVNVWPTAVQEIVVAHRPATTGAMRIVVDFDGHATNDRLRIRVERAEGLDEAGAARLGDDLVRAMRSALVINPDVEIVDPGVLEPPGAAKVRLVERVTPSA
jgi:phenylacetate-CoA ligase